MESGGFVLWDMLVKFYVSDVIVRETVCKLFCWGFTALFYRCRQVFQ